jgi:hypothetical protein
MPLSDHRSKKLRKGLGAVQRINDETQALFVQLDDALSEVEEREARRSTRATNGHLTDRFPALRDRS